MTTATCFRKRAQFLGLQIRFTGDAFLITDEMQTAHDERKKARKAFLKQIRIDEQAAFDLEWEKFKSRHPDLPFDENLDRVVWTDVELSCIVGCCLEANLARLQGRSTQELRSVLDWMFAKNVRAMIDMSGEMYLAPIKLVPFSFRFSCGFFGYDYEEMQEKAVRLAILAQNEMIEDAIENGREADPQRNSNIQILKQYLIAIESGDFSDQENMTNNGSMDTETPLMSA